MINNIIDNTPRGLFLVNELNDEHLAGRNNAREVRILNSNEHLERYNPRPAFIICAIILGVISIWVFMYSIQDL